MSHKGAHRLRHGMIAVVALMAAGLLTGSAAGIGPVVGSIALEGDPVPGSTTGQTFTHFDEPRVNPSGDATFNADFTDGTTAGKGVFLLNGGTLSAIAVSGQSTVAGTLSMTFDGPSFNNRSTVAFVARRIDCVEVRSAKCTTIPSTALFQKTTTGSLTVIAKRGDSIPGAVFHGFDDIAQNDQNDIAFIANYTPTPCNTPGACGSSTLTGVFLYKATEGVIDAIVLNGDTLPGTGGTQCGTDRQDIDGPWLNNKRTVAFIAGVICGGDGGFQGSLFYKEFGESLQPLVLIGDPGPQAIGGTVSTVNAGQPGLNDRDQLALKVELSGGSASAAVVRAQATVKALVDSQVCAAVGDPAPGTAGKFSNFATPAINQVGNVSMEAGITGAPGVTHGIFVCVTRRVEAIALEGQPKPDTESTFSDNLSDPSLSDRLPRGLGETSGGQHFYVVFVDPVSPTGVFRARR